MTTTQNSSIISTHAVAAVRFDPLTNHHSLHATKGFEKGELIVVFRAGNIQRSASYLTVQTGLLEHITLKPDFLQFVNHSCDPNVFFNTTTMEFTSLKKIHVGDELCFFYPSTEWDMAQPFLCKCNSSGCLKEIKGAAYLSLELLLQYQLTEFILEQLKNSTDQVL